MTVNDRLEMEFRVRFDVLSRARAKLGPTRYAQRARPR